MSKRKYRALWKDNDYQLEKQIALDMLLSKCEIQKVDFKGIIIGDEGPLQKLWSADIANLKMHDVDFTFAKICGAWNNSEVVSCDFSSSDIESSRIFVN